MPVTIVRTSGHCSRISSATVPWPAIDVRVVERVDQDRAGALGELARPRPGSRRPCCPTNSTVAPYALVAATLGSGAPTGMNTVASAPSMPAASATPWAWLPALAATTPRARSASVSREMRR